MTQKTIQNIAIRLNVHPIHIRVFLSNMKINSSKNLEASYKEYTDENPKPFVKWGLQFEW
ncbi:MAG TPA: hypothetical protein ENH35_01145 [Candidatus Moranbacteria bacterium]|nr:hypothetical protein [Candidatus Moranbacteria bacterium]